MGILKYWLSQQNMKKKCIKQPVYVAEGKQPAVERRGVEVFRRDFKKRPKVSKRIV